MTKGKIRFIVLLVSVALISLIGFQAYWIVNSYRVNELRLAEDINRSVKRVVGTTTEIKYKSITISVKTSALMKTLNELEQKLRNTDSNVQIFFDNDHDNDALYQEYERRIATDSVFIRVFSDSPWNDNKEFENTIAIDYLVEQLDTITHKSLMLEMLKNKEANRISQLVLNQIDKELIDSLLQVEFKALNLTDRYVYGIFKQREERFIKISDNEVSNDLLLSDHAYSARIPMPESARGNYFLKLYVFEQNQAILERMVPLMLVSLLLIMIVASGYYLTITTILKQKRLSEIKSDFINNMTHEFKTPVANISLSIESLLNFNVLENRKKAEKYLNIAKKENIRLAGMVENVLKTALHDNKEIKLKREEVNMHQIIDKVISSFIIQIENQKGTITADLRAVKNQIIGDYEHLCNVIFNLIDNGIKYSFGRKPEILVSTFSENGKLNITVRDHGIGISKKHVARIFDKFFRVPTGNIHYAKGFGLGLSYVQQVVHQHGGQVTVESEPGKGSEFSVIIPID
ncbi:HAMP domain-containing sensor histidine kinase [Fulvivirgaceae bacterium BMA12]|uniref:histidine kinase n=1 Tax=Agaribacillus aureus TaxID=3051825 RepID=A0ABT8L8M9_9BACT|nr:HAMP domain-containing sensor histidine kinase [Fulvivirgaceae bacterium BMA12]